MKKIITPVLLLMLTVSLAIGQGTSCDDATQITANGDLMGTLTGSDQHYYYFVPSANGSVTITATSTTPSTCGIQVFVEDFPSGGQTGICATSTTNEMFSTLGDLGWFDCSAGVKTDNRTIAITAGRYYYIRVVRFNAGSGETYTLNVNATVTLPVNMLAQDVKQYGKQARIQWTTGSEENNSHFNIERSTDGENFEVIGRVNGQQNSIVETEYQYVDNAPSSKNYYRIVQYDLDGRFEVFPAMFLEMIQEQKEFKLYSNGSQLVLNYQSILSSEYELQIINTSGQIVKSQIVNLLEGDNELFIDDELPIGVYFAVLKSKNDYARAKLIKTH